MLLLSLIKSKARLRHGSLMICCKPSKKGTILRKKANQTKSIIDWNNFTQKRNQVNNMKNTLKQDYFNTLLTDNAKRPKQLWKTLKTLVPNGKNTTTSVKRLVTEDGIDVTCPKGIADHFNNFFVNVGVTLASKFSTDTSKVNPPVSEKLFNFSKNQYEMCAGPYKRSKKW